MAKQQTTIPLVLAVYCPKDEKRVPIWHCFGSSTKGKGTCPCLIKATVHGAEWAEVECKWKIAAIEERKEEGL